MKGLRPVEDPARGTNMTSAPSTIETAFGRPDPMTTKRKVVRGITAFLWASVLIIATLYAYSNPTNLNVFSTVMFLLLFAVIQVQLVITRWAGHKHFRLVSSKLHGSTYISELHNLPNRNYLLAELRREMPQARTHGTPFTLVHFELETFESVRTRRGNDFANRSLSSITDLLQRITRSSDFVAYLGDAKFCVLLNECTQEQSWLYMKRVPASIAISDGHAMLDVKVAARVHQYDMEAIYATDVLREVEDAEPLKRKEQQRSYSEAA